MTDICTDRTGSKRKIIHLVAAARPNFMKIAPVWHELKSCEWCEPVLVHTGQHYDANMSDIFFHDFGLPKPDFHLEVGSGTHGQQTAEVMMRYETLLLEKSLPDWLVVVGDVNSTMACTIAAKKLGVRVVHLEAGLRSFDREMPEEINRIVTDSIADYFWVPSPDATEHLLKEGIPKHLIGHVGNIMIDTFEMLRDRINEDESYREYDVVAGDFAVVTLHRPSNVDNTETLEAIVSRLLEIARKIKLLFPLHPRTRDRLEKAGLFKKLNDNPRINLIDPLGYVQFLALVTRCKFIVTDSGGIQEETTYLGIPCLTLRANTERPITLSEGTNRLVTPESLTEQATLCIETTQVRRPAPQYWDGKTSRRIAESLFDLCFNPPELL